MWQGLISIMFLSQMYTCLTFFIYIHKLFIQSPLLSFVIARASLLILGVIMRFPVQPESTALFKSAGDKMQADYLTGAIKEPRELLCLLQGSLVKPLAAEPRLVLSKGFTVKCKWVPEESGTRLQNSDVGRLPVAFSYVMSRKVVLIPRLYLLPGWSHFDAWPPAAAMVT